MPRKKNPAATATRTTMTPKERAEKLAALGAAYDGEGYIDGKVHAALELERRKLALYEEIAVNRRQLRDFAAAGDMAREDVELIYPTKTKAEEEATTPPASDNGGTGTEDSGAE